MAGSMAGRRILKVDRLWAPGVQTCGQSIEISQAIAAQQALEPMMTYKLSQ